jgi:CPA2 family monovalent cation:H+ antiporter-2
VQIGEFSFVLAALGLDRGIISDYLYSMILVSAAVTIVFTPLAMHFSRHFVNLVEHIPKVGPFFLREPAVPFLPAQEGSLTRHVVICGYGRIGRELVDSLGKRGFRYVVIDQDPVVIRVMRKAGIPCVYGDAANDAVLAHANIARARVLAVTVPDPTTAELAIRTALQLNSRLDIIARAYGELTSLRLRSAGASEVVHTEFEAALEFVRHTMHSLGVSAAEIGYMLGGKRASHRGREE